MGIFERNLAARLVAFLALTMLSSRSLSFFQSEPPDVVSARETFSAAKAFLRDGRLAAAQVACEKAVGLYSDIELRGRGEGNPAPAKLLLGEILVQEGQYRKAYEVLMDANWRPLRRPRQDVLLVIASWHAFGQGAQSPIGRDTIHGLLGMALTEPVGTMPKEFSCLLENLPDDPTGKNSLATALTLFGSFDDRNGHLAESDLREALRLTPRNPAASLSLGNLLVRQGRAAEARTFLEDAARTGKGDLTAKAKSALRQIGHR